MIMIGEVTAKRAVPLQKKTHSSIKFHWIVFAKKAQPFEAGIKCPMWSAADWNSNECCKIVALTSNSLHLLFWESNCALQIYGTWCQRVNSTFSSKPSNSNDYVSVMGKRGALV